jgi:serine/threonine protein kinase
MAPEIVKKIEYYGKPADVWALGNILNVTNFFTFFKFIYILINNNTYTYYVLLKRNHISIN